MLEETKTKKDWNMKQVKLNANTIKALQGRVGEKAADTEEPHLQLWVGKRTMTFYVVIKHDGRQHFDKIGSSPGMTADMARIAAKKRIGEIMAGDVPRSAAHASDMTLGEAIDEYLESRESRRNKMIMKSVLNMFSQLRDRRLSKLTHEEIVAVHKANRLRPITANRAVKYVSASITKAVKRHGLKIANAALGVEAYKETPRDRYMSKDEAEAFHAKAVELASSWRHGVQASAILMMLYTGARKSNVLQMRFDEIDSRGVWTIPDDKFKSRRPHSIELGHRELEIIRKMKERRNKTGYVFEYRGKAMTQVFRTMRTICVMAGIQDLHIHDLRRTLGTWLLSSGAPIAVVSKKLGHSSIRITEQVYAHMLPDVAKDATEKALDEMLGDTGKQ